MGNICKPQIQPIKENEDFSKIAQVEEQRKWQNNEKEHNNDQKQELIEDDRKQYINKQDGQIVINENKQEQIQCENKMIKQVEAVFDQEVIQENIQKQNKRKSPFDYQLLFNVIGNSFIFGHLEDNQQLFDKMFYCIARDQEMIFKQGDKGSLYFIIERGQCEIIINDKVKKILRFGESFGELALLYNVPRSASVKALGDCAFWAMDKNIFRKGIELISLKDYEENKEFIQKVKCFQSFTDDQRKAITSVLIRLNYQAGMKIVDEGDQSDPFFIIKKGEVEIQKGKQQLIMMQQGDCLEEYSLQNNSVRDVIIKAHDDVILFAISRFDLQTILGNKIQSIIQYGQQRWAFKRHPIFKWLTKLQEENILSKMELKQYKQQDVIIEKGQQCTHLIVVLKGNIQYQQLLIQKGQMFGDQFLEQQNQILSDSLIMKSDGLISQIQIKHFFQIIGGSLDQIQFQIQKEHNKNINKGLEELISIKILGQGLYGNIYLVHNKFDKKNYAIKCISKFKIIQERQALRLAQKKQILQTINFPLIIYFFNSFKDQYNIYFLEEYIKGMQINDVIKELGHLKTYDFQFYIGSLILCMEYFHLNNIIYRNISPEHIIVDDQGFIKLIGLGICKNLKIKEAITFTITGIPHYMAPEILAGEGYTYSVDLWSIGIIMYEFICGKLPFGENQNDPYAIYLEIQAQPLNFPFNLIDQYSKELIEQLLSKIPEQRLGQSYEKLKNNQFFKNFNFDLLMNRDLKPPFIPPKNKLISDKDFQKAIDAGQLFTEVIKNDPKTIKKIPDSIYGSNWDQDL
ncbi:unnamed protein product [Paramecium sonneborni]|uniref:cGMP-dependent protein kinase n=1 Tax=Paramecium sonneborni TaxID=65129 RepID=A0A8S1QEI1_9CILI|nr:unnamed protein product [Paramecium sonneborni]